MVVYYDHDHDVAVIFVVVVDNFVAVDFDNIIMVVDGGRGGGCSYGERGSLAH